MGSVCNDDRESTISDYTRTYDSIDSMIDSTTQFPSSEILSLPDELEFPTLKPVKIFNNYLFGGVIGEGAFGKVKEIVDKNTLVRRAVKIVNYHTIRKIPNGVVNLEREIRVMGRLHHRNVVKVIETFRVIEKKKTYIVMEFCLGTVDQLIKSTSTNYLIESDAHYLFIQLIDGLEYLHSQGIIHNDIKPTNLLLSSGFVLKICDFGVSEELPICKGDDLISSDKGTPYFKAPEAVNGDAQEFSGAKVDIFAAGVTLYYMVCGKIPWKAPCQHLIKLFKKICEEDYALPPEIPLSDEFKSFLDAMLKKNPIKRMSIQQLREHEWYNLSFKTEYTRFKVTNYDAFYPKSIIKQKLEQLFGEPIRFSYPDDDTSDSIEWPILCTQSEPDISPIKSELPSKNPRLSCAQAPSPLYRRHSLLKWFRAVRRTPLS